MPSALRDVVFRLVHLTSALADTGLHRAELNAHMHEERQTSPSPTSVTMPQQEQHQQEQPLQEQHLQEQHQQQASHKVTYQINYGATHQACNKSLTT